jgi:hypothetical protein
MDEECHINHPYTESRHHNSPISVPNCNTGSDNKCMRREDRFSVRASMNTHMRRTTKNEAAIADREKRLWEKDSTLSVPSETAVHWGAHN